jgi:Protein of unknown function (DUF3376)/Patatin-like phospholipase
MMTTKFESTIEPDSIELFAAGRSTIGAYDPTARPLFGRNLRVALAMRGGVSLAVWIGGAVGELDLLRRIRWVRDADDTARCYFLWPFDGTEPSATDATVIARAEVYARAIRSRGYDQVEFDVLAGASAGGLNSVLYSVAQRVGTKLDGVLNVWVKYGAFMGLMQKNGWHGINAPLNGDGYFAPGVRQALLTLRSTPGDQVASHRAKHVVVDLSASVIDTEDAQDRTSSGGRGEFHFVGADPALGELALLKQRGRGIPGPGDYNTVEQDLARLAYSARSTSSLPGGFEPALIYSSFDPAAGTDNPDRIDYSFAFHLQREDFGSPYRVIDGGVTDNMPIDRAFLAIRGIPSEVYSDRAIIYLDPAPPSRPLIRTPRTYPGASASPLLPFGSPRRVDPSSRILKAVARLFSLRSVPESAAAKVEDVDSYQRSLHLGAAREISLAALSVTSGTANVDALLRAYASYRMAVDMEFISGVFGDPAVWQLGTDLGVRHAFAQPDETLLEQLEPSMRDAYLASPAAPLDLADAVYGGPGAIIDCCRSLLVWTRALEDAHFIANGTTWMEATNTTILALRETIYDSLDTATRARDELALGVCLSVLSHDGETIDLGPVEFATRVAADLTLDPPAALLEVRTQLDGVVAALAELTNTTGLIAGSLWAGFPANPGRTAIQVAAFCAAAGVPDPLSDVRYWEISADAEVANLDDFQALVSEEFRLTLKSVLALAAEGDVSAAELGLLLSDPPLTADSKLKGSALGAFAGFLSADWRRNDWLWGRMDAASSVLAFLTSIPVPESAAVQAYASAQSPDTWREVAQDQILLDALIAQHAPTSNVDGEYRSANAPLDPLPPLPSGNADLAQLRRSVVMGADSIANLRPGYRVGVATKTVHLALRAFGRASAGAWTVVVAFLLQPSMNVIATVVDLPRLFMVGVLLAGVWVLGDISYVGPEWIANNGLHLHHWAGWVVLGVLALIVVGVILAGLAGRRRAAAQWATVINAMPPDTAGTSQGPSPLSRVIGLRNAARVRATWMLFGGSLLMLVALVANGIAILPWPSTVLAIATGGILAIASMKRRTFIPASSGYVGRDRWMIALASVLFAAILVYPAIVSSVAIPSLTSFASGVPVVWPVAVAAFLISVVCNAGWQGGWKVTGKPGLSVAATLWWILEALIAGAAGWVVMWALTLPSLGTHSHLVDAVFVLVALFAAGTVQWYLVRFGPVDPPDVPRRG